MSVRSIMKFVRGGAFAAEVNVEILEEERSWAPYLSVEDAYKLDDVRDALRAGDIDRASRLAERVYRLTPVGVSGESARKPSFRAEICANSWHPGRDFGTNPGDGGA